MRPMIIALVCASTLSGCAGTLYTYEDKNAVCTKTSKDEDCGKISGVVYRPLVRTEFSYFQDRILNNDGEVTHFAGSADAKKQCAPLLVAEEKLAPSMTEEHVVQYDSAWFETSTFSTKLHPDGTLAEVGSSSTPGGKAIVDSLIGVATTIKLLNHGPALQPPTAEELRAEALRFSQSPIPVCSHGKIPIATIQPPQ